MVKCTTRSHNHSGGLPVPIEWGLVPPHSWYCFRGTENNLLSLLGAETQFRLLPVSRLVAIPTELSESSFDSAEDMRGEYAVMKEQTAAGCLWIRNFTVRRKR